MEDVHSQSADRHLRLTPRELHVLELISKEFNPARIESILGIETTAVDALIERIVDKMNARSPSEAAMRALMAGLIGPNANPR